METRANITLIGVSTLIPIVDTAGFFIWLVSVRINRYYATYAILFDDVSGLAPSGGASETDPLTSLDGSLRIIRSRRSTVQNLVDDLPETRLLAAAQSQTSPVPLHQR